MTSTDLSPVHPPFDPELAAALAVAEDVPTTVTPDMLAALRSGAAASAPSLTAIAGEYGVDVRTVTVARADAPDLRLLVACPPDTRPGSPALYWIHGGGVVLGDFRFGIDLVLPWAVELGVPVVSVDYRLAPAHPDPAAVEDCYAGLVWVAGHAAELGVDPSRLVLAGHSAGAGLAAGTALLARDRSGPRAVGQLLLCPMLDDREQTPASRQLDGVGVWDRTANRTAWEARLGARRGGPAVEPYSAPARATDLSGLPPTFVDVGSVDTFRDEAVGYATRIWEAGGVAELHVWPGAYHCFEILAPTAAVSVAAVERRTHWLRRVLRPA
ncbi:esterase [Pseudonocardia sulfidoxydans NBRC 16205]|uniref:Esterase n=1 Tax=Pseudonocardia sulfidoxydans NBRC 16205 TaxID=1223511 RepID=A0A511DCI3_9PSEU|nr:alpha/beta hydrolase [Pseudonocardia sulfidoxydans]GEL22267.1 esterase [Pseudonocardia sulfidoxydans NBRC 16205]